MPRCKDRDYDGKALVDLRDPSVCDRCRRAELDRRRRETLWGFLKALIEQTKHRCMRVTRRGKRCLKCNITVDDLKLLWNKQRHRCALTGWKMTHTRGGSRDTNVSVDRIDPHGNYTSDNIQLVCSIANLAKWESTQSRFVELCRAVVSHHTPHHAPHHAPHHTPDHAPRHIPTHTPDHEDPHPR